MGQVNDTILARIKKLLALSASSNEHEAALAASKAQELAFQYDLEISEVEGFDLNPERHVNEHGFDAGTGVSKIPRWKETVLDAVTITNMCKRLFFRRYQGWSKRRKLEVRLIGRKSDVEVAQYIYIYLTSELERLANEWIANPENRDPLGGYNTKRKRSWLEGAADSVARRLITKFYERKQQTEQSTALVVTREHEVKEWMSVHYPKVNHVTSKRAGFDYGAYVSGVEAGNNVSLRAGIKTGKQQANLLT